MTTAFKLKIKNFGPIIQGYDNPEESDFFTISGCTVIIGEQGTGKSTIAKLSSTFLWLEKSFAQKRNSIDLFNTDEFLRLCKNQKIDGYFFSDSYICYESEISIFEFKNSIFTAKLKNDITQYLGRKIMYIPSERNLVSVLEDIDNRAGLPYIIQSLSDELGKANKKIGLNRKKLPINGFEYFYDSTDKNSYIFDINNKSKVKISESSSGLQSFVPLFLVSEFLSDNLTDDFFEQLQKLSKNDKEYAEKLIRSYFTEFFEDKAEVVLQKFRTACSVGLSSDFTEYDINVLKGQLKSIMNVCFFNIVEEPEQNLFPESQIEVIKFLVKCMNRDIHNALLLTTHSPFVLSSLNNMIFASKLNSKVLSEEFFVRNCKAYLVKDGKIIDIYDGQNGIIDTEIIDDCATLLNQQYFDLCEENVEV